MTEEASMYEPRIGDLVQTAAYGDAAVVDGTYTRGFWRYHRGGKVGCAHASQITPLRPDAPGQRVRGAVGGVFSAGMTREAVRDPLRDRSGFYVEWDSGGGGPWQADHLIRIADQAPAAPVEAPRAMTPAEVGAAMHAALCPSDRGTLAAAEAARKAMATASEAAIAASIAELRSWQAPGSALLVSGPVQRTPGPTCQHCGSGIVAGLLRDTCPRGCDLTLRAEEPEPDHVGTRLVPMRCGHEAVWIARGRGAIGTPHPTREGAIAAWREAVRAR